MNGPGFDEMEALRSLAAADLPPAQVEAIGCRCRAELARCARPGARRARRVLGGLELAAALAVGIAFWVWGFSSAARVFLDSRLTVDLASPALAARNGVARSLSETSTTSRPAGGSVHRRA